MATTDGQPVASGPEAKPAAPTKGTAADHNRGRAHDADEDAELLSLGAGETDPFFGVTVAIVILQTPALIVYLDKNYDTYWRSVENQEEHAGRVFNRSAELEAIPLEGLTDPVKLAFRTLVAEGVARALTGDLVEAAKIHDRAEVFVTARLKETARSWYLASAMTASIVIAITAAIAYVASRIFGWTADPAVPFSYCVLVGGLGASFSIISRLGSFPLDPAAGRPLHVREAIARVMVGAIGGAFFYFVIKTKKVLPDLDGGNIPLLVLLSFVAGVSERLVPNLVAKAEALGGTSTTEKPPTGVHPLAERERPTARAGTRPEAATGTSPTENAPASVHPPAEKERSQAGAVKPVGDPAGAPSEDKPK